jgi:hypothetical protein
MTDEKYVFVTDVKEKARTGRGARNKRTHAGKRGRVKFPSDYLTKKELNAMNGEAKAYRLNEPMNWEEFREMPDDLKVIYIQAIRDKYKVSDTRIANMMGVSQMTFSKTVRKLGIGLGRGTGHANADNDGFLAWCNGLPVAENPVEEIPADEYLEDVEEQEIEEVAEEVCEPVDIWTPVRAIPCSGSMTFVGVAQNALRSVSDILGTANVRMTITWEDAE